MITTAVMTKRKRSEHYVNNKEFLAALIKYREDVEISFIRKNGREPTKEEIEAAVSAVAGDAKSIDVEVLSIKD